MFDPKKFVRSLDNTDLAQFDEAIALRREYFKSLTPEKVQDELNRLDAFEKLLHSSDSK